jgi:hypothetical protein
MQTKIGELLLSDQGKWYGKYHVLRVENQNPIVSVTVKGGDDRAAFLEDGGTVEVHDLVFIERPDMVDLEITIRDTEIKTIPLNLEISTGF